MLIVENDPFCGGETQPGVCIFFPGLQNVKAFKSVCYGGVLALIDQPGPFSLSAELEKCLGMF